MTVQTQTPILGFAAYSGTGKTTLLVNLIPVLKQHGLEIGVIKHAHHKFEIDHPGKDSYKIRMAGVDQMLVGSKRRWALMVEHEEIDQNEQLQEYLSHLDQKKLDLILIEGFKPEAIPKIELHRPSLGNPLICKTDNSVIAIATDATISDEINISILDLNDHQAIAQYIIDNICNNS